MPTNESGYTLTIGPDADGKYFDVDHGADYDLPAPPVTVADLEAAAAIPLDALKVDELRARAADLGVDTSGRKADLIERLSTDPDPNAPTGTADASTTSPEGASE